MLDTRGDFADLVSSILGIFNIIVPVLGAVALLFFMFGVVRYIQSRDKKWGKQIMWSLLALFVFFSVWGLLRFLLSTFGVANPGPGFTSSRDIDYSPY